MRKRALITGVSGQDGIYLTQELLQLGYIVAGASRSARGCLDKFRSFGFTPPSEVFEGEINDDRYLTRMLNDFHPDVIFHFSGQSSVRVSLQSPTATWASIAEATEKLLYYVARTVPTARILNAASSECFGPRSDVVSSSDKFKPTNPYSEAKVHSIEAARRYRREKGLYVANAFLFPHESHMRDYRFLVGRILGAARSFYTQSPTQDLDYITELTGQRDIGLAREYVRGVRLLTELDRPADCVIGTGVTLSLQRHMTALVAGLGLCLPTSVDVADELDPGKPMSSNCAADVAEMLMVLSWQPPTTGLEAMSSIGRDYLRWLSFLPENN
jgi:GDPmannose 4,6-dehydratase